MRDPFDWQRLAKHSRRANKSEYDTSRHTVDCSDASLGLYLHCADRFGRKRFSLALVQAIAGERSESQAGVLGRAREAACQHGLGNVRSLAPNQNKSKYNPVPGSLS
jgi:hypothetical protein